jgi:hypothetical protein
MNLEVRKVFLRSIQRKEIYLCVSLKKTAMNLFLINSFSLRHYADYNLNIPRLFR